MVSPGLKLPGALVDPVACQAHGVFLAFTH